MELFGRDSKLHSKRVKGFINQSVNKMLIRWAGLSEAACCVAEIRGGGVGVKYINI